MLSLWDLPCPQELTVEVVACLGPVSSMELRCVSRDLLGLLSDHLLRRAAEAWSPACTTLPFCERVRMATTYGDELALAVLKVPTHSRAVLEEPNKHGQTALMWAAGHGCAPLCALLLAAGVNLTAVDSSGWTALFRASWHGRHAAASVLIRAGADVNIRCAKYTPLMAAARFGHHAVVQRLVAANADSSATTVFGDTALSLAMQQCHQASAVLLQGGCQHVAWSDGWRTSTEGSRTTCSISSVPESCRRHALGAYMCRQAQRAFDAAVAGG